MINRTCTGCGTPFTTNDLRKTRCRKNCSRTSANAHAARTRRRDRHELEFIAVDGEGVTRHDGTHVYDMLSVGSQTLVNDDGSHLTWQQIFGFLYDCFLENTDAVYAGFFLGYDFTQWFRTLPADRAAMLLTPAGRHARRRTAPGTEHLPPFPVQAGPWEFDILGTKRFKLRPAANDTSSVPWMYVNDAGPFFQASFLSVIDPAAWDNPVCTVDEYLTVLEGKAARGTVMDVAEQLTTRDATIRYNIAENAILSRVLGRLNEGFADAGVRLGRKQWFGPGQAAQAWMNRIEAPRGEQVRDVTPRRVLEAARDSYYGGWFEIFAHGHIPGEVYEYDINSAYPQAISELPCLLHGRWVEGLGSGPTLVRVHVKGSDPIAGAMPHREPDGRVLRPAETTGWHWFHEVQAAHRAGLIDEYEVMEALGYEPCPCPPPFGDEMEHLYGRRLEVGKNTPAGKAYKLVYNSAYGKLAQSIGDPKYANPVYASLITSQTRTTILDAIATHPTGTKELVMVATDGVYFRTPHPGLYVSPTELGAWDMSVKHGMTLFMPGVYWDDTTRATLAAGTSPRLKSRGVSSRDLAQCVAAVDAMFADFSPGAPWPDVTIPVAFTMTTATQALARGAWDTAGTVSSDAVKTLSSNPITKRVPGMLYSDRGALRSYSYVIAPNTETTPYNRNFGIPPLNEGISQDGTTPQEDLRHMLNH